MANDTVRAQMVPDKPIMIEKGGAFVPLSNRTLSAQQLEKMLGEVAPPEAMRRVQVGQAAEFLADTPKGSVQIQTQWSSGRMVVLLRLQDEVSSPFLGNAPPQSGGGFSAAQLNGAGSVAQSAPPPAAA
ncbi:MAG: hypothetical protein AAGI01_06285, partial [Myxococcota bacterium]